MKVRSLLTIISVVICSVAVQAQESALLQSFTQELKANSDRISTIRCTFTQTRSVAVLAKDVVKAGDFYFAKPNRMLLAFNDGDHIKMTEEWFEMKSKGSVNAMKVSANPMLKNLNAILSACMIGDIEQMLRGFDASVESSAKEWLVRMTPMRGKASSKVSQIELRFNKGDMSLNSMKMIEKTGDYTLYRFSNKSFNKAVDAELFNIVQ